MEAASYFFTDYETSRNHFQTRLFDMKKKWPKASHQQWFSGNQNEDNSTDILLADSLKSTEKLLIITTGLHGIEGYAGSAGLNLFLDEIMNYLNPSTTGIRLIHAVNPWGMKHFRRVTKGNIDLNRNFHRIWAEITGHCPEIYSKNNELFLLDKLENVNSAKIEKKLTLDYSESELKKLKNFPEGQHRHAHGLYYGGITLNKKAQQLAIAFSEWAQNYEEILHIDLHTGGGPKNKLTMIFSENDPRTEDQLRADIHFPLVSKAEALLSLGASTARLQEFLQNTYPEKKITSSVFEMGTVKEDLSGYKFVSSTMILENYFYWNENLTEEAKNRFFHLFYPASTDWQHAYLRESYKAMLALLSSEGFIN
ncbi:M14 family metallopeptidase [Alkalicoccus daliensis]|uniref:DUF2817 domain-containing protein n=1 Tax=Alkalicoccus daliensis TaxID=745820 RepID=A0A1H0DSH4_9BACI|nr:M14 family metallopeptidase [Alkalicoccus daliensis]SDN72921.1 Protein of unknown function [Alkalicoccus daliensis]